MYAHFNPGASFQHLSVAPNIIPLVREMSFVAGYLQTIK